MCTVTTYVLIIQKCIKRPLSMVSKLRYYSFKIELTQKNPGRVNPKGRMHVTYFM